MILLPVVDELLGGPPGGGMLLWSLAIQAGLTLLIAVFYVVLSRSLPLAEVRIWALAWVMEAAAVGAGLALISRTGPLPTEGLAPADRALLALYTGAKTAFVLLLIRGTRLHLQRGARPQARAWLLAAFIAAWGAGLGLTAPQPMFVLPIQWSMVALVLATGGFWALLRPVASRSRWLGWLLFAEGLLYLTYVPHLVPLLWGGEPLTDFFEYSSLLDAGADLLLALGILVALESTNSDHLQEINRALQLSQERLRQLVDLDPLTGLRNRRGLRGVLDEVKPEGAAVVFVDIDDFKEINDRYGHAAGDACLVRAAAALNAAFRPGDIIFRWGGDEFLVVAPGLDHGTAEERIAEVREALAAEDPRCPVSAGIASLPPGAEPEPALRLADERMYRSKRRGSKTLF